MRAVPEGSMLPLDIFLEHPWWTWLVLHVISSWKLGSSFFHMFVFIYFTFMHKLVIFSTAFFLAAFLQGLFLPSPQVHTRMKGGLKRKGEKTKTRCWNQMRHNVFWLLLHYFYRGGFEAGLGCFLNILELPQCLYLQFHLFTHQCRNICSNTCPKSMKWCFAIYHLIFNADIQFSFKTQELS